MNRAVVLDTPTESGSAMKQAAQPGIADEGHHTGALSIRMLGGFRMSFDGNELPDTAWRLGKAKSMVKLLALSPEHRLHREQVIDQLWYDLSPEAGSNNFHQALHVARRTIASILPDVRPTDILRLRQQMLSLDPPFEIWTDVNAFEHAVAGLQGSTTGVDALYRATDIYGGDLLPEDLYEEWTQERRELLREQYLSLLIRIARIHESRREPAPAIDVLRRVVSLEPLREEAHATLMRIYALSDRRQQALRQYERLRETLDREVGASPDPVVTELYNAIETGVYPLEVWQPEAISLPRDEPTFELRESIQSFLQRKSDFVDRESELQILESALSSAINSQGRIVLVAGEPGIGKTRLIEEFARYCRAQRIPVYWGRGYDGAGAPPYWPWVQIVRAYLEHHGAEAVARDMGAGVPDIARIVPDILTVLPGSASPPVLDADQERFRLFDSLTTFLKNLTQRTPLVIVLEDLHWLDRSPLLVLEFLATELQGLRLVVIGSYRPVEVDRRHPLVRTLAELSRAGRSDRIYLEGLSPEHVARFSEIAIGETPPVGLPEAIHFQTGGNPFFMREIVQLLVDEGRIHNPHDIRSWRLTIPHGIRETINLRADRLTEPAYQVLTAAAVAGQEFDLDVIAAVTDRPATSVLDALDESLVLGLVNEIPDSPGRFRFSHAITREAIAGGLSQARRSTLHLRTGQAIERLWAKAIDERLPDLAYHFAAAASIDAAEKAIDYLLRAARQATGRIAHVEAAEYLRRAVDTYVSHFSSTDGTCCELHLQLGDALAGAGESADAQAAHEHAATLARNLGDTRRLARAAIGVFDVGYYSAYWYKPFVDLLDEGLQGLTDDDWDLRVRVMSRLATALQDSPQAQQRMRRISEESVELALRHGDQDNLPFSLYARFLAHWSPENHAAGLRDATRLVGAAEQVSDTRMALIGHALRIHYFIEDGSITDADAEIERYATLASASRQPHYLWADKLRRTMRLITEGRFREAEDHAVATLNFGTRAWPGPSRANYLQQLFIIRREQDRLAEIEADVTELTLEYPELHIWRCILAFIQLETGSGQDSRFVLDNLAGHRFEKLPRDWFWLANLAILSEMCLALDDTSRASELYDLLMPFDGRLISPGTDAICLGPVSYYLGLLATALHDWSGALDHFGESTALTRSLGFWPWFGYSCLGYAEAMTQLSGPNERGSEYFSRAGDIADRFEMPRLFRLVNSRREEGIRIV